VPSESMPENSEMMRFPPGTVAFGCTSAKVGLAIFFHAKGHFHIAFHA
jgi:hypothetical protein